jgi:hypothetical protein
MDRTQQAGSAGSGGTGQSSGQDQQDLGQSDFTRSDQGMGTSESQTGRPWDPAAGEAAGHDHPQTIHAEPIEPSAAKPSDAAATAARNDSETGGR